MGPNSFIKVGPFYLVIVSWDKKPTQTPTGYMLTIKFKGMMIIKIGNQRRIAKPIAGEREQFLKALNLDATIFTHPPSEKEHGKNRPKTSE